MKDTYDAFISYNRGDRSFAERLEQKLERYKLPISENRSGRHLNIFRDEQDMVGSDYFESIEKFLKTSSKLILICSPRAEQSSFVDDEVQRFIDTHGYENVVPVLIDGLPNNEAERPEQNAFPPALMRASEMPLAIRYDTVDLDRQQLDGDEFADEWYTLLANLLDVSRAEIEQRDRKRRQRRVRSVVGGLTAFSLVMGALAVYAFVQRGVAQDQTDIAETERDNALQTQSLFLADLAEQETERGNAVNGILLALEALPESLESPNRPYVAQAETALYDAVSAKREQVILNGHTSRVTFATFSPDSEKVLTASHDHTARLWSVEGAELAVLGGHKARVAHAEFSRDGRLIATVSTDGVAQLWTAEGGPLATFDVGDEFYYHVSFRPDGKRMVTAGYSGNEGIARVWDTELLAEHVALKSPVFARWGVSNARFSNDGKLVITGDRTRAAVIFDAESGAELWALDHAPPGSPPVREPDLAPSTSLGAGTYFVTFNPASTLALTASADTTARIWDARSGRELHRLHHDGKVFHAAFSNNSALVVTVGADSVGRLWDAHSGALVQRLDGHSDEIRHAAFSADDRYVVTSSRDDSIRIWAVQDGSEVHRLRAHADDITHSEFSPDGRWVVSTGDTRPRIWSIGSALSTAFSGHDASLATATLSPDGTRVLTAPGGWVTTDHNAAYLWDTATGEVIAELVHGGRVNSAEFSDDGSRVVTSARDGTARVWDGFTGQQISAFRHPGPVGWATFGETADTIITVAGGLSTGQLVRVINVADGSDVSSHTLHRGMVNFVVARPGHRELASASNNEHAIRIWNYEEHRQVRLLSGERAPRYSSDGSLLATQGREALYLRDGHDDANLRTLESGGVQANHFVFSPDSSLLAAGYRDGSIRIFATSDGRALHVLRGHEEPVNHVAFSPDGTRLASGSGTMEFTANARDLKVNHSEDDSVRIWSVADGGQIVLLDGHDGRVRHVAFSPDGAELLTASEDRTARLWKLFASTQQLIDYAKSSVPRRLTDKDRQRFFLETGDQPEMR